MWIATADGLNFFDGYNWNYWKKESGHLTYKNIDYIHKDQNGLLWLFNNGNIDSKSNVLSIDILDPEEGEVHSFVEKMGQLAPFKIEAIQNYFEDRQQQLYFWVNQQLWQYTGSAFELVKLPPAFAPLSIFSDGTFSGMLEDEVVLMSPEGELLYRTNYHIKKDEPYYVMGNRQCFLAWQEGLPCMKYQVSSSSKNYEVSSFRLQQRNKGLNFHFVHFDEKRGHFWIFDESYLYMVDTAGNILYQHKSMPRTACVDKNGNFWSGKFGITILRPEQKFFKRYLHHAQQNPDAEDLYRCRGIVEKDDRLYITTYKGTRVIDLKTGEIEPASSTIDLGFVVLKDRHQQLWGAKRQVNQLDPSDQSIQSTFRNASYQSRIWSMFEDISGQIWIGGHGLYSIEKREIKNFSQYNTFSELKEATILFIQSDKSGVIWVGSNEGLYQLDPKKGIIAGYGQSREGKFHLPSNRFQHMYQDEQGIYWLATEDVGLLRWDKIRGDIQIFDKTHGLLSNNIYAVYEDGFGYLWMSSFNGLIRFEKATQHITVFNEEDGISGNEFNRISHHQADDGCLFFGGQNGVTGFHPKDFLPTISRQAEIELAIKHIAVFGKDELRDTFPNGSGINLMQLDPGARVIDLEMKVSDLFWTDKAELHYTLHQLDQLGEVLHVSKDNVSRDQHIELLGMKPGNYQLEIKLVKINGKQLGQSLIIPLKIAIPIFHTKGFWIATIVILGICFWGFLRFRTAHLHKRKAELEKLVKERAEKIFRDQKTITSQAELIAEMREQLNRKDQLWLEQFQSIINERLDDPNLDLPSVIDDMDIGRSVFYEKVKTLTNMTPNQYIQELRLVKAKAILEQGQVKTVKEVTYSVGMSHPNYFSKRFKERFGISPSSYFRYQKEE